MATKPVKKNGKKNGKIKNGKIIIIELSSPKKNNRTTKKNNRTIKKNKCA